MAVAVDDNVHIVIKNLKEMLSKYNLILSWNIAGRWLSSRLRRSIAMPARKFESDIM